MISVLIKSAEKFDLDPGKIRRIIEEFLKESQGDLPDMLREAIRTGYFEISVAFVELKTIRELNRKFRGISNPTSVLSFFQGQAIPHKKLILGDIAICPEVAQDQNLEISFLIKHGLKNLLSEIPTAGNIGVGLDRSSSGSRKSLKVR